MEIKHVYWHDLIGRTNYEKGYTMFYSFKEHILVNQQTLPTKIYLTEDIFQGIFNGRISTMFNLIWKDNNPHICFQGVLQQLIVIAFSRNVILNNEFVMLSDYNTFNNNMVFNDFNKMLPKQLLYTLSDALEHKLKE